MTNPIQNFENLAVSSDWSFTGQRSEEYSHNYHRYPAKFISPLARKVISKFSDEDDVVFDIYGGCGTTLLESKLLGRQSFGFDINPVAKLITDVKTKALKPNELDQSIKQLKERINIRADLYDYNQAHERVKYWFAEPQYQLLSHLYDAILAEDVIEIQSFLLCAFSNSLKNYSHWLMKSIKPTVDKSKNISESTDTFFFNLKRMVKKNHLLYDHLIQTNNIDKNSQLKCENLLDLSEIPLEKADLILTSPPYVTSYEYADLHQLTLYWFGDKGYSDWKKHIDDYASFKKSFVGSANVGEKVPADLNSILADQIVDKVILKDKSLGKKVKTYFAKMNESFKVASKILKPGKIFCAVIGNTKLKDVKIQNAEVALEQLLNLGFEKIDVIKRDSSTNKMITPFRDKDTGKFTSKNSKNSVIAYSEEFVIMVKKNAA